MTKNYIQEVREHLATKIDVEPELLDLYTLLVFTRGAHTTWEDVHDAWSVWTNQHNVGHPSLIPFHELEKSTQQLDSEYAEAIKDTAREINPRKINF